MIQANRSWSKLENVITQYEHETSVKRVFQVFQHQFILIVAPVLKVVKKMFKNLFEKYLKNGVLFSIQFYSG